MRRRLAVKPGITGLWQVSGRSDLPWDEAIRLDVRYVENWSSFLTFRFSPDRGQPYSTDPARISQERPAAAGGK